MGRFTNTETGVVVSVADDKDDRFAGPLWTAEKASTSKSTSTRKTASDSK